MKIEDLTLKEIKQICEKQRKEIRCDRSCPLYEICIPFFASIPCDWTTDDMEREVKAE